MRIWSATGSMVCSDDGIIIDIPVINPATGIDQLSSDESYSIAVTCASALNRREKEIK